MLPLILGAALVGAIALSSRRQDAGPSWQPNHGGPEIVPGTRYRVSFDVPVTDNPDLYDRVITRGGWTDYKSYALEVPADWPKDDVGAGRWRFEGTYTGRPKTLPNPSTRVYVVGR